MKKILIIILVVAIGAASCSRAERLPGGEGGLRLRLKIEETKAQATKAAGAEFDTKSDGGAMTDAGTKASDAAMTDAELLSSAVISIYKADFSGLVRSFKAADSPEVIYLAADSYRIDVVAGEKARDIPSPASWVQKSYKGSAAVVIEDGKTTSADIAAGIDNVVSEVSFAESVEEAFAPGFSMTVGTDLSSDSSRLTYTASNSGKEGYFIVEGDEPSLLWKFEGSLKSGAKVQKSGEIKNVEKGKKYRMTPRYTVSEGMVSFVLVVDLSAEQVDDIVVFEPVSTGLSASKKSEIWAGHAVVHADVDESEYPASSKISFRRRIAGTAAGEGAAGGESAAGGAGAAGGWTDFDATRKSEGVYQGIMTGLSADTEYEYALMIDGEQVGASMTLKTDSAPQMPNYDFEATSNAESDKWTSFYDPSSADPQLRTKFWDSGSSASAGLMGASYAICYSDTDVPSGIGSDRSVRLQSLYAVVKFAAGNIFTGEFAGLDGMNGKVNFGRPWTARPTAVRLWYKYKGGKVDHAGGELSSGEYDIFSVQIALGTWSASRYGGTSTSPVQVNTGNSATFWNYSALPETIAYGCLEERGNGGSGEWKQVTIPLNYTNETTFPTHILISCAASKYGDYFAGCSDSALWLDNFELLYE